MMSLTLNVKQEIKKRIMRRVHARDEIVSRIATKVLSNGVPRFLTWDFETERSEILLFVEAMRIGGFQYRFASSATKPVLYGSIFAFMLHSFLGAFDDGDQLMDSWIDFFDRHQSEADGFFRDPAVAGDEFERDGNWGDGWGVRHLAALVIIPYARAGRTPKSPFKFLEPFYDGGRLAAWLARFDFTDKVWSQSNYIMNLYSLLQFARDHMDERRANAAITQIVEHLRASQNAETGMWHAQPVSTDAALHDAIRGAYHFYPLFEYEGIAIEHQEKVIDHILKSQNAWGAFEQADRPAGACEDIDAVDPLVRFARRTGHRLADAHLAAQRSMIWHLACRNPDGGSVSILEHGFHYGGHPETSSRPGESNLFATWFRTLATAYLVDFLDMPHRFEIGRYPGYEQALPPPKASA